MRMTPGACYAVALLLVVAAIFVGRFALNVYRTADETSHWPSTPGTVVSARMAEQRLRTNVLLDRDRRYRFRYSTKIAYKYTVNGKEYVSNSISLSRAIEPPSYDSRGAAREGALLALYPEGKKVTVYYDPGDPATSFLEPAEFWLAWLFFGAAGVLVLMAFAFFSAARRPA